MHTTQAVEMRHTWPIGLGAGISCDEVGEVRQAMTCIPHGELEHATIRPNARSRTPEYNSSAETCPQLLQLGVMRAAGM